MKSLKLYMINILTTGTLNNISQSTIEEEERSKAIQYIVSKSEFGNKDELFKQINVYSSKTPKEKTYKIIRN